MLKHKNFIIAIVCVIIMLMFSASLVYAVTPSFNANKYSTATYVVESGDTLWEIGSRYCKSSDDIRDWIQAVEELNDTTALIHPGQRLTIYISEVE